MKEKILRLLRENDEYISGQAICESLGVSRTAVWKVIKQLKNEGYEIDSVSNKGYKLTESPDVMSEAEISSRLDTEFLGKKLYYFETIDSTNEYLKHLPEEETVHGTVCIGDHQSAGKGRLGRTWLSPRGSSIYISYLLKPDIEPANASMLTIVAALSVAKAINKVTGLDTSIKWPNDIVVNSKKVCGILTEMTADMDRIERVIIGIGINVNMESFDDSIKDMATSLRIESGMVVKRADIIINMLKTFEEYYSMFVKTEDLSLLLDDYNSILVNRGKEVRIIERDKEWAATAVSMNKLGELIVNDNEGKEVNIRSGEVSVRGLYGYC
ncbi:MAG: biotin--[Lachnospiraceae bacterium]|nr:biotin--[acetyl-CoA-carboxylase] ligase [Lachnospiraceae bacterium]